MLTSDKQVRLRKLRQQIQWRYATKPDHVKVGWEIGITLFLVLVKAWISIHDPRFMTFPRCESGLSEQRYRQQ